MNGDSPRTPMNIAFLHPYKRSDHYFVETAESAMLFDLRAAGHTAEAVDYLFDQGRPEDAQLRELRERLVALRYDLIFLERPWSAAMVESLRGLPIIAFNRPELVESGLVDVGVVAASRSVIGALVEARPPRPGPRRVFLCGGPLASRARGPGLGAGAAEVSSVLLGGRRGARARRSRDTQAGLSADRALGDPHRGGPVQRTGASTPRLHGDYDRAAVPDALGLRDVPRSH